MEFVCILRKRCEMNTSLTMAEMERERRRIQERRDFLKQYVLNRANTLVDGMDGRGAAESAIKAWNTIVRMESQQ